MNDFKENSNLPLTEALMSHYICALYNGTQSPLLTSGDSEERRKLCELTTQQYEEYQLLKASKGWRTFVDSVYVSSALAYSFLISESNPEYTQKVIRYKYMLCMFIFRFNAY
jgi:hypothetical protein